MALTHEQRRSLELELRHKTRNAAAVLQEISAFAHRRAARLQKGDFSEQGPATLRRQDYEQYFADRLAVLSPHDKVHSAPQGRALHTPEGHAQLMWQVHARIGELRRPTDNATGTFVAVLGNKTTPVYALVLVVDTKKLYFGMKESPSYEVGATSSRPWKEAKPIRTEFSDIDRDVNHLMVGVHVVEDTDGLTDLIMRHVSSKGLMPYPSNNFVSDAIHVINGNIAGAITKGASPAERNAVGLIGAGAVCRVAPNFKRSGVMTVSDYAVQQPFAAATRSLHDELLELGELAIPPV